MSDSELDLIRHRKLMQLKKRMKKEPEAPRVEEKKEDEPAEILNRFLVGRAWEVLRAARIQYPQAAREVEKTLVKLMSEGKIVSKVTGEELYGLFRRLGFRIHLETRIRILEHGKVRSLEDKIRERSI